MAVISIGKRSSSSIRVLPRLRSLEVIDTHRGWVNIGIVDAEDFLPRRSDGDALDLLAKQDLDPLSVAELDDRIARLAAEVERTKLKRAHAVNHKASADALFKR